jgi:hypothetical protein
MQPVLITNDHTLQCALGKYPRSLETYLKNNYRQWLFIRENRLHILKWLMQHAFIPVAILCVDGRVSDFSTGVLALFPRVAEILRSPGLLRSVFKNPHHTQRFLKIAARVRNTRIGDEIHRKRMLVFVVAHYSSSQSSNGCAACGCNLKTALEAMHRTVKETRRYVGQDGVVLECLMDTDHHTIEIFTEGKSINTSKYLYRTDIEAIEIEIRNSILDTFGQTHHTIPDWNAFVTELTEHLVNDVRYSHTTLERPIELAEHQERMALIGGPLETTDHNSVFLVEKCDILEMVRDLEIGLRIIARNVLRDALKTQASIPEIPLLVSLDYDEDRDRDPISHVALGIIEKLQAQLGDVGTWLADQFSKESWWVEAPAEFKRQFIQQRGNLLWVPAVYKQTDRQIHLVQQPYAL